MDEDWGEVEGEREIDFAMGIIWITVLRVAASWKICLKIHWRREKGGKGSSKLLVISG